MRSRLILRVLLTMLGLSLSPGLPQSASPQQDDLAGVPRISQEEFKQALATGSILVLDVRDRPSYANAHIPGALSMPLDELPKHVSELKRERRPIVAYCS